jgi:hypothetical protein
MSKISLYVGLNIQNLEFQCGGGPQGFEGSQHIEKGVVHYSADGTHRHLIEQGLHPQKVAERVLENIKYCQKTWDLHISTHSEVPINLIGHLIHSGDIQPSDVRVFVMSEDNQSIQFEATFNAKGFLENWPYGFMDFDTTQAKKDTNFSVPTFSVPSKA